MIEEGTRKAKSRRAMLPENAFQRFFNLPFLSPNGADGETRTLVGQCPAVYETAAVAAEPHRQNGGSPRIRTVFSPVKSRDFTIKVCNPNATRRRSRTAAARPVKSLPAPVFAS